MANKFVLGELSEQHPLTLKIGEVLAKSSRQAIAFVMVDKMKRAGDTATKAIQFNFEEGQSLTLVLRKDGDVVQIKMNNKAVPLVQVIDYDKPTDFFAAIEDLGLKIRSGQEKFSIKRAKARVLIPRRSAPMTVKRRIDLARQALREIGEEIDKKNQLVKAKQDELTNLKSATEVKAA